MESRSHRPAVSARSGVLPAALLAVAVVATYANTFGVPFYLDDFATIPGNPTLRRLWPLSTVLFPPPEVYSAGRPLLNLSFALNYAVGGTSVAGYHLVNLAIHLSCALLLFGIINRLLAFGPRDKPAPSATAGAFLAAGLAGWWALHPLHTSAVTYVSQRAECLMGCFYLLTFYLFLRGLQSARAVRWQAASVAACAAGMMTKEVMVTAPVVILLFDWRCAAGTWHEAWRQRGRYYLALAGTWLILGGLMLGSRLGHRAVGLDQGIGWFAYVQLEWTAVVRYLRLTLWPDSLVFDYGANLPAPSAGAMIACLSLLLALLGLGIFGATRRRGYGVAIVAFFLLLAPTSSVVPIAGQPIAESRAYLPLAAALLAVVAVLGRWRLGAHRSSRWLVAAGAFALAWSAFGRNAQLGDPVRIWHDTTVRQPTNSRAWVYLSEALKARGKMQAAVDTLLAGLPHHSKSAEFHNNIAVAYFQAGKPAEAAAYFRAAFQLNPNYAGAYYNYGAILFETGNAAAAVEAFQHARRLNPGSVETENYLGLCYSRLGNRAAAIAHFENAVRIDPQHPHARANLESARKLP